MEESLIGMFQSAPFVVSFLAGLLSFLSPCVLPLIPAYLSYISGLSLSTLRGEEKMSASQRWKIVAASMMFVLGFSTVFVILGASMARLIGGVFENQWFSIVAGLIIIAFGLHTMGVINIKFLNFQARADFGDAKGSTGLLKKILTFFAPFLLGLSFALGWTPCIGPIFGSIILLAGKEGGAMQGVFLMMTFAAGLGAPFLLTAILTSQAMNFLNRVKKHFKIIEIVAGLLLVLVGIAIATGDMGTISAYMMELFS